MIKGIDTYILTSLLLFFLTIITLLIAYRSSRKGKKLSKEVERKEKALEAKSIDEIVKDLEQSIQEIEQKIEAGKPVFDKLKERLKNNAEQLEYIDVGLLPPTFSYDDRESLKEQVQEWAIEEGGVLVEDDLFFNIVFPHRVSDK